MRRFVYDAGEPRETVRNTNHTKPRDVTKSDGHVEQHDPDLEGKILQRD
jgi:hypothetical protein